MLRCLDIYRIRGIVLNSIIIKKFHFLSSGNNNQNQCFYFGAKQGQIYVPLRVFKHLVCQAIMTPGGSSFQSLGASLRAVVQGTILVIQYRYTYLKIH